MSYTADLHVSYVSFHANRAVIGWRGSGMVVIVHRIHVAVDIVDCAIRSLRCINGQQSPSGIDGVGWVEKVLRRGLLAGSKCQFICCLKVRMGALTDEKDD